MLWTSALLTAAALLAAAPGATALNTEPSVKVKVDSLGGTGLDCVIAFEHATGDLAAIEVEQITHEELLDATSYVSDTGWFAGHELGAAGELVDCATL